MKVLLAALVACCAVLVPAVASTAAAQGRTSDPLRQTVAGSAGAGSAGAKAVSIQLDQATLRVSLGDRFTFTSILRNDTGQTQVGLVSHLDVVGLDAGVYVDPEDWSSERSQFVGALSAGQSTELKWEVQAVNPGPLAVYVTAMTDQAANGAPGGDMVAISPALRLTVADRSTATGGGILPLVIGVPVLALLVIGAVAFFRRRSRRRLA